MPICLKLRATQQEMPWFEDGPILLVEREARARALLCGASSLRGVGQFINKMEREAERVQAVLKLRRDGRSVRRHH